MIYKDLEEKYGSGVYYKRDLEIISGKGVYLYDSQGNEYIDCVAGHGVCLFGHSHPKIVQAIKEQSDTLISCPEIFYNDKRAQLLEKIAEITPKGLTKTFLSNSGAEAVEAALKFSRKITGKTDIISFTFGFHGRTMGALSATWKAEYKKPFLPLVPGFCHTAYNNLEKLQDVITDNTAAIILEPVQGEGGVKPANMDFIKGIREICDEKGILMIVDEVQTGFGRTGELFAINRYNVSPDILCLGKGIAGGIPMGATVVREDLANLDKGEHGSTFGGNPLACNASLAAIRALKEEKLVERSKENGEYLLSQLKKNIDETVYKEIRGLGLMVGIEMKQKVGPYLAQLMEKKVLALTAGKLVVRYLPPLIIEKEHIDRVVEATGEIIGRSYLLKEIIKIYSPSEKEKEVSDFLFNFLKNKKFNVEQDKEWNVISKIGSGSPYILLTSHMDTVSGELPFRIDGKKIYGRGACDAKSPLAALLSAFIRFKDKNFKGTLIFAGVTGEEAPNSRGTLELMKKVKADFIFLGEPGSADGITIGYKGRLLLKILFKGKASHSSSEEENPIIKFIDFSNKVCNLHKGDNLFESLSYSPTSIFAESESNVVPSECKVTIDLRVPPGLSHQEVLKEISQLLDGEIELVEGVDGVITSKSNILVKTLVKAIREKGFSPKYKKKTGSSDMNLLVRLTENIVTYGPGDSSLDHTDMECIDTDEYLKSIDILEMSISEIFGIISL